MVANVIVALSCLPGAVKALRKNSKAKTGATAIAKAEIELTKKPKKDIKAEQALNTV